VCKTSVCALLLGLTLFARGANPDDKKTPPATPEKAISPEEKAVLSLTTALRSALGKTKDSQASKALVAAYSEKLLIHARKHLHDPSGMEAVLAVIRFNWDQPRSKRHKQEDYDPKTDDLERIVKKLVTAAAPPKAPAPLRQGRQAVERGLEFLQKDAAKWRKERQCSTCHHGTMTVWALCEANSQGYEVWDSTLADTTKWTRDRLLDRIDLPRDKRVGWNMVSTPAIYLSVMALCVPKQDVVPAAELKRIAGHLLRHQETDGSWAWSMAPAKNRAPPFFESDEVATLLSYAALRPQVPADPKVKSDVRDAREKAEAWLAKTKRSNTTQAAALRLLVKALAAAPAKLPQTEIDQLLARQNKDGGWGQLVGAASDAYATGQTLYVLSMAGLARDRAEVQRGVMCLVNTQKADGSWPMTARSHPGATPAKNLVPIVYFGSAWATLGLMRSEAR
jgi:hypothetical protein